MKKVLCLSLLVVLVLAFAGCEAGLSSNDGNGSGDGSGDSGFSFSDLYSRIKALEDETTRLQQVNDEQAEIIERLNGELGEHTTSINSLTGIVNGRVPLYRIAILNKEHFYTTSIAERDMCINRGDRYEGVQCHVFPQGPGAN